MRHVSKANGLKGLRVGSKVSVRLGTTRLRARIVEDRGLIGAKGRRLFRVQPLGKHQDSEQTFEVPADHLTVVR